jgi:RNA polymerase sigma factor (sigma-70 family)
MNVHFTYKVDRSPAAEQYLQLQIDKLGPRLNVFNPDMVSLRGLIEVAPKSGFSMALNLKLPSGQLAARSTALTLHAAIRTAFEDLGAQLGKHKDHLRSQYRYPGVRPGIRGAERPAISPQAAFEDTVAAVRPAKVSSGDVNAFVNANLWRLRRYVERELNFRRDNGQKRLAEVSVEEVVDEAIASALDEHNPRPEKISLEPWLYRLSRSAMDRLGNQIDSIANPARPSHAEGRPSLDANDEERMQYYQPDASTPDESLIADQYSSSPEEEASRQELMSMVERSLRGVDSHQREAFLLFTMEGFRPAEIAAITGRELEQVQADIKTAREHLRSSLTAAGEKRQKPRPEQVPARPRSA